MSTTATPATLGETTRVRLRAWRAEDVEGYREWLRPHQEWHRWDGPYFPVISPDQADQHVGRIRQTVAEQDGMEGRRLPDRTVVQRA